MQHLLGTEDGWYHVPTSPQQHYFFRHVSLCKAYKEIPPGAHHDNDPRIHCDRCQQKVNKLMAVGNSIAGKKLNTRDVLNLIDILGKIDLNKGSAVKIAHGEEITAVLGHSDGKKTTLEVKRKKQNSKKKSKK